MKIDKYLYEIIDSYKTATSIEEKDKIFDLFCSSIWSCKNKRRVYTKTIKFKVRNDLLESDIGQIFNAWSEVDYIGYKAMSKDTDWCSLIRQKINNLYTRYFDKEVVLKKDYMDLLKAPYNLYYRWIKGAEMNADELTNVIEDSVYKAAELKSVYQKQKMDLSWNEYKLVVEDFLRKSFDNCKLIENYEFENLTNKYIYEFANEDNFYISYICDSLESYMLNYQKKYYKLYVPSSRNNKKYIRCKECGKLIEKRHNRMQYCSHCKREMELKRYSKYNKKRNNHN